MISEQDFKESLVNMLLLTNEEVERIYFNCKETMLNSIISAILVKAKHDGCVEKLGFIIDRILGSDFGKGQSNSDMTFIVAVNEKGKFVRQRPILLENTEHEIIEL